MKSKSHIFILNIIFEKSKKSNVRTLTMNAISLFALHFLDDTILKQYVTSHVVYTSSEVNLATQASFYGSFFLFNFYFLA